MTQDFEDCLVRANVPEHQAVVRATRQENICHIVELNAGDIRLVSNEGPHESRFLNVIHVD